MQRSHSILQVKTGFVDFNTRWHICVINLFSIDFINGFRFGRILH